MSTQKESLGRIVLAEEDTPPARIKVLGIGGGGGNAIGRMVAAGVQGVESVDCVIAIPNDRLLQTVARNIPIIDAFRVADDVLRQAVQGISDIIMIPGLLNLDFNDVRAVMKGKGDAVMGSGIGEGDNRAV